jgi:hypothetical protein
VNDITQGLYLAAMRDAAERAVAEAITGDDVSVRLAKGRKPKLSCVVIPFYCKIVLIYLEATR